MDMFIQWTASPRPIILILNRRTSEQTEFGPDGVCYNYGGSTVLPFLVKVKILYINKQN